MSSRVTCFDHWPALLLCNLAWTQKSLGLVPIRFGVQCGSMSGAELTCSLLLASLISLNPGEVKPRMTLQEAAQYGTQRVVSIVEGLQVHGVTVGSPIGTAFFISSDGHLVTNAHVVRDMEKLAKSKRPVGLYIPLISEKGTLYGLDTLGFEIVDVDDTWDVAILKAQGLKATPKFFTLCTDTVLPGTEVALTGFPLHQDAPLTVGARTATGPTNAPIALTLLGEAQIGGQFYVIDRPIHRGSSGSPVYRLSDSCVIGIASGSLVAPVETPAGPNRVAGTAAMGYVHTLTGLKKMLDEHGIAYSSSADNPGTVLPTDK